ncbi:glycosyltransferase family 2 protein [Lamprobacter modestohalophilus]
MSSSEYIDMSVRPTDTLDVVIVNFNAGKILTECITSVLRSELTTRVTVVDNLSTDGSLGLVRKKYGHDRRLVVRCERSNLGFARASNLAAAEGCAPYILFLNPDCIISTGTLERLVPFMETNPRIGMCGCLIQDPSGREQSASRRLIPDPWIGLRHVLATEGGLRLLPGTRNLDLTTGPIPSAPIEVEAISGALMLVRRTAMEDVGMLDDGYFLHCEDLDWFVRFRQHGWAIYFIPDTYAIHHKGVCSAGRPMRVEWHKHRGMIRFFRKFQSQGHSVFFNGLVESGIWLHCLLAITRTFISRQIRMLVRR